MPELVRRALPGLPLTHMPSPPPAVSAKPDTQYFSLGKGGPCWDHMVQTKIAGVYVPGEESRAVDPVRDFGWLMASWVAGVAIFILLFALAV